MTTRITQFFDDHPDLPTPFVAIDIEVIVQNYRTFEMELPAADIHYAIKANPDTAILRRLASLGSHFDCASLAEIKMVLACGVEPHRISFGNTIKKERDIREAFDLGIRLFATDSESDVRKLSRAAPGSEVFCRVLTSGEGAEWPLSRKFGCEPEIASSLLLMGHLLGLKARGISFHVGSQMNDPHAWRPALVAAKETFDALDVLGIKLDLINLGGGFPTRYTRDVPATAAYGEAIMTAVRELFGDAVPALIIEPGRGMVGNAGIIKAEVVLVSDKSNKSHDPRWVFLDIGKFGGLAETMDEAIRYRITTDRPEGEPLVASILAGPTCDSADVLYEKTPYLLPEGLKDGDFVYIDGAGAYTTTYSAVAFNGFDPLASYIV